MRMNRSIARVALLGALLFAACADATGTNAAARPPAISEVEEAAAAARAALGRLPLETRLGEISNERLRRAVQATYRTVVEIADNRDPGKVASLSTKFERAYATFERETARGEHKTCASNCKALDGGPCPAKCKAAGKKFCGCKLIVFGCVVAECIF